MDNQEPIEPANPSIDGLSESASPEVSSHEDVRPAQFAQESMRSRALEFLRDVPLEITVELGRCRMSVGELFNLGPSSIVELAKASDEPLDVRANGVLIARGEAVVVNDRFGVRLTAIVEPETLMGSLEN